MGSVNPLAKWTATNYRGLNSHSASMDVTFIREIDDVHGLAMSLEERRAERREKRNEYLRPWMKKYRQTEHGKAKLQQFEQKRYRRKAEEIKLRNSTDEYKARINERKRTMPKKYICDGCPANFKCKTATALKVHRDGPNGCLIRRRKTPSNRNQKFDERGNAIPKKFACEGCPTNYKTNRADHLKQHRKTCLPKRA